MVVREKTMVVKEFIMVVRAFFNTRSKAFVKCCAGVSEKKTFDVNFRVENRVLVVLDNS